jgi:23S rRNA pseudouridine1911/1915/1917 synthase
MNRTAPWRLLVVGRLESRARLDAWLASHIDGLSRRQAKAFIENGHVTIDGRRACKGDGIERGSEVAIWSEPPPAKWKPLPDPSVNLDLIFEDGYLVAIDKPSGIPSVPLSPEETGCLANGLAARFPECGGLGRSPGDTGLVQRLDKETSGVILAAKTAAVYDELGAAQKRGEIKKKYLALVRRGECDLPDTIDFPLAPAGPGRSAVKPAKKGVRAETKVRAIRTLSDWLLIEAEIHVGRRHQIRSHLAAVGFPIAGDMRYGEKRPPPGLKRLFLHASEIGLKHPVKDEPMTVCSPLPSELLAFIDSFS